jgi:glycosyltransferase involved in cell wall biosynthesis
MMDVRHPAWDAYPTPADLPPVVINDPALPLVSIVTPSFNQGCYIRETIESVLNQDYPNIEYWVIDGGSNDDTLAVLAAYESDPRLNWMSEPDAGQSDAINKGWSRCRGAILAWLNSDDIYLPGAIRAQVNALLRNPACGVVYSDAIYVGPDSRPIARLAGRPYDPLRLVRIELPIQPTTFLRRCVCEQIGPLNNRFRYSMDTEYWVRAARVTSFCYERFWAATYRLHQHSKTVADFDGFYRDWLAIVDAFFSDPVWSNRYRDQRRSVYADIYSAMANLEAKQGALARSLRYLIRAAALGGLRPRMAKWPVCLLERYLPVAVTPKLTQMWAALQRRSYTSNK